MDKKWTEGRIRELAVRRDAGETFSAIGADHGISAVRVRQLLFKLERLDIRSAKIAAGWTTDAHGRWVAPTNPKGLA